MRKIFITAVIICYWIIHPAVAFEYQSIGVKGGLNISNVVGDNHPYIPWADEMYNRFGYAGGIYAVFHLQGDFYLQPELLYSQRGTMQPDRRLTTESGATIAVIDIHYIYDYIDLPILVKYRMYSFSDKIFPTISIGPGVSYFSRSYIKVDGGPDDGDEHNIYSSHMKNWEFSGIIALGGDYKVTTLEIRYLHAFTDHYDFYNAKNEVWSLMLGVNL